VAMPIIIDGEHLATFFTGQFFYDDDNPAEEYFRAQAREFGFDEESYLEALSRVPAFTREEIRGIMDYYRNLVHIMIELGLRNLELRASEERYALAVRGSNDGIMDLNLLTGEAYHSPRWKAILGYEDYEIDDSYKEWENRVHPDDYQRVMEVGKAFVEGRAPLFEVEYRLRHKDGGYRWVLSRGACLRDSQGKAYRMAGSLTDITSRKTADELLKRNEALLGTVLETLPVGVWILQKDGGLTLCNEAAKKIWSGSDHSCAGWCEEYKGRRHDTGKPIEAEEWAGARATDKGETVLGEVIDIECFDGNRKTIVNSAVPLKNDNGEVFAAVVVFEDITELKKLERQLLHAQKMESIGILAGGVAHDFNNLLTAISGYGQLIWDVMPPDDELLKESIEQVLKAAERGADLTGSLLAFSRKQVLNPRPVLIDTIIRNTGKLIQRIIGEDIEFGTAFYGEKMVVMADAGQIEQVLMNLATNARDAMPHGGALSITVKKVVVEKGAEALYDLSEPGKYVLISVADTGAGIGKRSIERIFEPFYTTKEVGKGTGLGLSIVYGIIKQHDGSVMVSSDPGKGTTFEIYLPLAEAPAMEDRSGASTPAAGGNETLLVVEDEEAVTLLLKKTLERAGYRVITSGDGEDAVSKFREHGDQISLVISDVVMPKKNGREMLEEIRRMKPGTKFVFISGYTADIIQGKGILEDDVDFLRKPFVKTDLLRKVRETLDKR
jgi:two-component system cell cycle sensor histidine kinase/response regulator CckA